MATLLGYTVSMFGSGSVRNGNWRFVVPPSTNNTSPVNLNPGDHVFTKSSGGVDFHHGIFVGDGRVIHFTPPTEGDSAECTCHTPRREGGVVKTCLNCFLGDPSKLLCVYEYGIRVSAGHTLENWIKEKLNPQRVIYTRSTRYGCVNIGILLDDDETVLHVRDPRLFVPWSPPRCENCGYKRTKKGGFVKTCFQCFLGGNLLYVGEHGIPDCRSDEHGGAAELILALKMDSYRFSAKYVYHEIVVKLLTKGIDVPKFFRRTEDEERRVQKLLFSRYFWKETRNRKVASLIDIDDSWEKGNVFTAHDGGQIKLSDHACPRSPTEVVAAASELLEQGFGNYHLKLNNSEHFATICKTGDVACTLQRLNVKGFVGPSCAILKPGDHIFSERRTMRMVYFHHGIHVGDDLVIHFTRPSRDGGNTNECGTCGHIPTREGKIVKTCISCFLKGNKLSVYEYGIRVSPGDTLDEEIKQKLNPQRVIYTRSRRYGFVNIGILLDDDKTVLHLRGPRLFVAWSPRCAKCSDKPTKEGGFVKTCLQCFVGGNLLYIGEHGIPADPACHLHWPRFSLAPHVAIDFLFTLFPFETNIDRVWASNKSLYHQAIIQQLTKGIDVLKFTEQTSVQEFFTGSDYVWPRTGRKRGITLPVDDSWLKFSAFYVNDGRIHNDQTCLKAPDVIDRANRLLRDGNGDYHLLSNNCEHFATTCKLGRAVCTQLDDLEHQLLLMVR